MTTISGADGCKGGWVVITKDLVTGAISWRLAKDARDLIYPNVTPQVIAVDIPIGLPDLGPRACDKEARQLLRPGRASSVFPAPIRPVLAAKDYPAACQIRFNAEGKRMSLQAWAIAHKIRDVDDLLRENPDLRGRVREVHPEVSFYYLNGKQPMGHSKKTTAGRDERRLLLTSIFGDSLQDALDARKELHSSQDDILDAFAALWTAERIAKHEAKIIPCVRETDSYGLTMEIVA